MVCWESSHGGGISNIYAQLFNADGSKQGTEFQVNTYTEMDQIQPSVSQLSDGGFIVCWQSSYGSDSNINAQLFNQDGTKRGKEFKVNTFTGKRQSFSNVSRLSDDRFIISWASNRDNDEDTGIYAKYYYTNLSHSLSPFNLIEPNYDHISHITNPTLRWQKASAMHFNFSWDLEYDLYLSETDDFSNPLIIPAIYDTVYTVDSLSPGTTYFWKVLAKNNGGDSLWSSETKGFFVSHDAVSGIERKDTKFNNFNLFQNYPNPFNPRTVISYTLKYKSDIEISVHNALGQKVATLVNRRQSAGRHKTEWDATGLTSGIYFYRLQAKGLIQTRKMLLLK